MTATYTVKMERVGPTGDIESGDAQFDGRVGGQGVDAAGRKEVLRCLCATKDLEQDWNVGWNECHVVDFEFEGASILEGES